MLIISAMLTEMLAVRDWIEQAQNVLACLRIELIRKDGIGRSYVLR